MGKKHKGLTDPLEGSMPYLVQHNRQGKGEQGGKYQEKKIKVQGIPNNLGRSVALKEKFKIRKPVKGTAKDPQAVIKTLKGYNDVRVRTVPVYEGVEGGRQQQQVPVGMSRNVTNKTFFLLCHNCIYLIPRTT
jgi:hypothetical protein